MQDDMLNDLEDDDLEDNNELDYTSYVCEDCDYRWEDATQEELDTDMLVCPMCGSTNVTQL